MILYLPERNTITDVEEVVAAPLGDGEYEIRVFTAYDDDYWSLPHNIPERNVGRMLGALHRALHHYDGYAVLRSSDWTGEKNDDLEMQL